MAVHIGNDWDEILREEWEKDYYQKLRRRLIQEYQRCAVYPDMHRIFRALSLVSYADCRVVIVGQDPYHGEGQANGLSFSVDRGIALPPSLKNIYQEIESDLKVSMPQHGDLTGWAKQGVLLLNSTLTVRQNEANSHAQLGWSILTDHIMQILGQKSDPMVFMLWGSFAKAKRSLITNPKHLVLTASHPSPLSAYHGFFGCKHFSKANAFLQSHGQKPISWQNLEVE